MRPCQCIIVWYKTSLATFSKKNFTLLKLPYNHHFSRHLTRQLSCFEPGVAPHQCHPLNSWIFKENHSGYTVIAQRHSIPSLVVAWYHHRGFSYNSRIPPPRRFNSGHFLRVLEEAGRWINGFCGMEFNMYISLSLHPNLACPQAHNPGGQQDRQSFR